MNDFYEIMDLIYQFNKKYPEIRFGQLMHNMVAKEESLFYLSDTELLKRLNTILDEMEEDNVCTHEIIHMGTCAGCGEIINE
jgi:hypothetical protein